MITEELLRTWVDVPYHEHLVKQSLDNMKTDGELLVYMRKYAKWNSYFAAGVAQLCANIARQGELFLEPGMPRALGDRSQFIASFFFDAARDEFDDHINRQRDPHRSMAQAFLAALARRMEDDGRPAFEVLDKIENLWMLDLCENVVPSYDGIKYRKNWNGSIFSGIGYHLGSELLADREFSIIDAYMRDQWPGVVSYLLRHTEHVADADHRAYAWIGVHSGIGGAAEADHFAWAIEGTNKAIELGVGITEEEVMDHIRLGFVEFARDHSTFFELVQE